MSVTTQPGQFPGDVIRSLPVTLKIPNETVSEHKYYFCTVASGSFVRTDGKRLEFIRSIYRTNNVGDIVYLDAEAKDGDNPYIRFALPVEIEIFDMASDPVGTLKARVDDAVKQDIRRDITAQYEAQNEDMLTRLEELSVNVTDEAKLAGIDALKKSIESFRSGSAILTPLPTLKGITSTGSVSDMLARG